MRTKKAVRKKEDGPARSVSHKIWLLGIGSMAALCLLGVVIWKKYDKNPSTLTNDILLEAAVQFTGQASPEGLYTDNETYLTQITETERTLILKTARDYCRQKYTVDYRLLTYQKENSFFYELAYFFSPEYWWKGEDGQVYYPLEYATAYFDLLVDNQVVMESRFETNAQLLYGSKVDVCRGILWLRVNNCRNMEALQKFLGIQNLPEKEWVCLLLELGFSYLSAQETFYETAPLSLRFERVIKEDFDGTVE